MRKIFSGAALIVLMFFMTISGVCADQKSEASPTPALKLHEEFNGPCKNDPRIVGDSFTFKGRASFRYGNLTSLKIWMVGTQRLLGAMSEATVFPKNLEEIFRKDLDAQVYGMFTVYPLTPYQKGVMQFVCIDSVKITKVIKGPNPSCR
jgi:hypothetical protein